MPRRNPFLFKPEEYQYLHRVFLKNSGRGKFFDNIKKKDGMCLDKAEITHVKKKFEEWKEKNPKGLLFA
tara:strand:- start:935 stop:1141 length:207 start_codon:yes stop_codon:yes gene_type:complete